MIIKVGQQRSRMTRLFIITARFLTISGVWLSRPPNRKFQPYTTYTYVGQIKVNHNKVMCQMPMKLPAIFDQNPPHTFNQIVAKHIPMKNDLKPST